MRILTENEKTAVQYLRQRVADLQLTDEQNSDDYLVRWIRARELNLEKAEEMLRASLKWREANNIDSILAWQPPDIYFKLYPLEICGYIENNVPVIVVPSRFMDMTLFWELDEDEYTKYSLRNIELLIAESRKQSKNGQSSFEYVGIYDLRGLNIRSFMNRKYMNYVQSATKQFDENYPELVKKIYFVYPPTLFALLMGMVKPFIPKRTMTKFEICGSDPAKMKQHISQLVPIDMFPPSYGGLNQEFEDTAFQNCGKKSIIRKMSFTGEMELDGFMETNIPAGQKMDFGFDITESNTRIEWCFKTENFDIGFSIIFTKEEGLETPEIVHPFQRVNAQASKQKGTTVCPIPGKYTLVFDNTYSRMRSKALHLKVDIIKPNGELVS